MTIRLNKLRAILEEENTDLITPTHVRITKIDDKDVTEEETKEVAITVDVEPDIEYIEGTGPTQCLPLFHIPKGVR